MSMMRAGMAVVLTGSLLCGVASAGPITWGYMSTRAETKTPNGTYTLSGVTSPLRATDPGTNQMLSITDLVGEYSAPTMVSPIPVEGPTLTTQVELTDTASGQSGLFDVPISFIDIEPAPEGETDMHVPFIRNFTPLKLVLGENQYTISGGGSFLVVVPEVAPPPSVSTPEPSSLALAAAGLMGLVGAARRRRLSARESSRS